MNVLTKSQNYRLYADGAFGNKLRTWDSWRDVCADNYAGRVVMRYKGAGGGAQYPRYGDQVLLSEVPGLLARWSQSGARDADIRFNEAAPDSELLIQGEVMRSLDSYSLFWSSEKTTMRRAMQNGQQADGLRALMLLRASLSPAAFEDIQDLFDRYPASVIEFSAYRRNLGSCRGRNAVIWEVRNY